jgi:HlyD family secretion protein
MINRIVLYVGISLAALSWGRAIYVRGFSALGDRPYEADAAKAREDESRYPDAWPIVCSGRVEASDGEVDIFGQIPGPLSEVRVTDGDFVPKGGVLAVIEGAREARDVEVAEVAVAGARAKLDRVVAGNGKEEIDEALFETQSAEALLASESSSLARDRALYAKRMISREDYERRRQRVEELKQHGASLRKRYESLRRGAIPEEILVARAEVDMAEAKLRRARVDLEYRTIRAPVSGLVIAVYRHAGDSVSIELPKPVLRMVDTSRLRLRLEVDEADVPTIRPSLEGTFRIRGDTRVDNRLTVQTLLPMFGPKRLFNPDTSSRTDARVLEILCVPTESRVPLYPGQRVTATFTRTAPAKKADSAGKPRRESRAGRPR